MEKVEGKGVKITWRCHLDDWLGAEEKEQNELSPCILWARQGRGAITEKGTEEGRPVCGRQGHGRVDLVRAG